MAGWRAGTSRVQLPQTRQELEGDLKQAVRSVCGHLTGKRGCVSLHRQFCAGGGCRDLERGATKEALPDKESSVLEHYALMGGRILWEYHYGRAVWS